MVHHVRCPILFSNSLFWIAPNFIFFHLQLTALQRRHPVGFPPGSWTQGCPLLMNKKSSRKIRWEHECFPTAKGNQMVWWVMVGQISQRPQHVFFFHTFCLCAKRHQWNITIELSKSLYYSWEVRGCVRHPVPPWVAAWCFQATPRHWLNKYNEHM